MTTDRTVADPSGETCATAHRARYQFTRQEGVKGREMAVEARRAKARAAYESAAPLIRELRSEMNLPYRTIAAHLNAAGLATPWGPPWGHVQVMRAILVCGA